LAEGEGREDGDSSDSSRCRGEISECGVPLGLGEADGFGDAVTLGSALAFGEGVAIAVGVGLVPAVDHGSLGVVEDHESEFARAV